MSAIGLMFGSLVFGWVSDRYQIRQVPMCVMLAILAIATILFGAGQTYWQLIVARMAQGMSGGGTWAIGYAMVGDVFPPSKVIMLVGTISACALVGSLVGPTVGGLLFDAGGRMAPFIFGGGLVFFDLLARIFVGEPKQWGAASKFPDSASVSSDTKAVSGQQEKAANGLPQLTPSDTEKTIVVNIAPAKAPAWDHSPNTPTTLGLDTFDSNVVTAESEAKEKLSIASPKAMLRLLLNSTLLTCFLTTLGGSVASASLQTLLPLHLGDQFNMAPGPIGLLFMALVIPNVVATPAIAWVLGRYRLNRFVVMAVSMVLLGIALPLLSLPRSLGALITMLVLTGVCIAMCTFSPAPLLVDYLVEYGNGYYAVIFAVNNAFHALGMAVGPIFAGPLYTPLHFEGANGVLSGILGLLAALVLIRPFMDWRRRRLTGQPTEAANKAEASSVV
ncbi:hypothetical protein H4R35_001206 [Dimargaris xerosporica]|nr:hypothetical protein H4R35_001206 [Dimargaris xerosporica]